MIEFWLAAGLLLLVALAFLLIPVLRGRKAQTEEDRTALNVALYQERLAELQGQQAAGVLTAEQLQAGQAEAARELLADTEDTAGERVSRLGKALPLIAALLVPFAGLGLYMHWGASQQLAELENPSQPGIGVMTAKLERAVQDDPKSAESWYFLGRIYMAQERAGEAAAAYEQAVGIAGRAPELLGQWAQALYFANQKQWSQQIQALTDEALKADPQEATSLGLLGIAAFEDERFAEAIDYWQRLVALMPAEDPSRQSIQGGIERARERLQAAGQPAPAGDTLTKSMPLLKVRVELAPALQAKVQPGDTVFVFARAVSGPPMPLAVKRLTVAELPADVELSDRDAMMEQLKISSFAQVQLVARISRAGNATAGEWIGNSQPIASSSRDPQQLLIDSADQRK
ncbi:c-type cytochrome biogenesis protein CcmI [Pseudomonas sp. J452]|uniref:c-type cytochrome biogenesis protein CcmI n=1 Tax=Pseudomonas sp. J452 TaxID=2898441 RepID=UPI0021ADFE35|nr:c-type cytochrome biogenesis protein CcmI [Pseudomonas sp. J452]UUY07217.1 c-type cytochrome biogenesis protein CcmI [Pseudomonas sp. J452]